MQLAFRRILEGVGVYLALISPSTMMAQSIPVPEFFGIYAKVDGKLASMIGGKGTFTPNQSSLQVLDYYNGKSGTQTAFVFQGNRVSFLVFDAAISDVSATVELYKLPYARNMITQPEAVGGLLGQITGHPQANSASPLQEYIVAKMDDLKIELLQKPVPGQPQMVELVPGSDLVPGVYCLFAIRNQGGQTMIFAQIFEWNGTSGAAGAQFCIDMLRTGGFGGLIEDHDARLEHPYFLAKDNYAPCSPGTSSGPAEGQGGGSAAPAAPDLSARKLVAACNNYAECFHGGTVAYQAEDWEGAIEGFKSATSHDSSNAEAWVLLGRAFLGAGRTDDLSAAWDKALSLGTSISVDLCRQRGIAWCERGTLVINAKAISFTGKSQLFSTPPSEVTAYGFEGNTATMPVSFFKLKVGTKNYTFDPVPVGVTCEGGAAQLLCPPPGVAQQMAIGIYILNAIPKLASGAFAKPN